MRIIRQHNQKVIYYNIFDMRRAKLEIIMLLIFHSHIRYTQKIKSRGNDSRYITKKTCCFKRRICMSLHIYLYLYIHLYILMIADTVKKAVFHCWLWLWILANLKNWNQGPGQVLHLSIAIIISYMLALIHDCNSCRVDVFPSRLNFPTVPRKNEWYADFSRFFLVRGTRKSMPAAPHSNTRKEY